MAAQIFLGHPDEMVDVRELARLHRERGLALTTTSGLSATVGLTRGRALSPEQLVQELLRLANVGRFLLEQKRLHPLKHLSQAARQAQIDDAELRELLASPAEAPARAADA